MSASPFTINNQSGEIFTTAELDYEQYSKYTIIVKAEDNGTPSKSVCYTVNYDDFSLFSLPEQFQ